MNVDVGEKGTGDADPVWQDVIREETVRGRILGKEMCVRPHFLEVAHVSMAR